MDSVVPVLPSHSVSRPTQAVSSLRVAVVDDEAANCRLAVRLMTKIGIPGDAVRVLTDGMGSVGVISTAYGRLGL